MPTRRVDMRECKRVQSALISHTHPDSNLAYEEPYAVEIMRRAVLCIEWLKRKVEKNAS